MANFNFNKLILGGHLATDPELRSTPNGVMVTTFCIAVNRRFSGKDSEQQSDFINCVAWRQTAEFVTKYFRKGSSICVVGSVQSRSWTDQYGQKHYATDVIVDEVQFVDSKGEQPARTSDHLSGAQGEQNNTPEQTAFEASQNDTATADTGSKEMNNDDLPF